MSGPRPLPERLQALRGQLIVSCQAWPDDPFHAPSEMTRFALAAAQGGAAGVRTVIAGGEDRPGSRSPRVLSVTLGAGGRR